MNHRHLSLFVIALLVSTQTLASPCTIKPPAGASDAQLTKLATLSKLDAEKIALAKFKSPSKATIASAELEAEHGCLIWSFDVHTNVKSGIQEVNIDAGNGHVISSIHEGPRKEALEKAAEKKETAVKPKP